MLGLSFSGDTCLASPRSFSLLPVDGFLVTADSSFSKCTSSGLLSLELSESFWSGSNPFPAPPPTQTSCRKVCFPTVSLGSDETQPVSRGLSFAGDPKSSTDRRIYLCPQMGGDTTAWREPPDWVGVSTTPGHLSRRHCLCPLLSFSARARATQKDRQGWQSVPASLFLRLYLAEALAPALVLVGAFCHAVKGPGKLSLAALSTMRLAESGLGTDSVEA